MDHDGEAAGTDGAAGTGGEAGTHGEAGTDGAAGTDGSAGTDGEAAGTDRKALGPSDEGGLTLLVADDDADIRLYVSRCVLADAGPIRRIVEAADGETALALLRVEAADVIVCDVLMPRLGGLLLCERIRTDPRLKDIPVLLITGEPLSRDSIRLAFQAGADGLLPKPFNARRLCEALETVIDRRAESRTPDEAPSRSETPSVPETHEEAS